MMIARIAVIGAGTMGHGIAHAAVAGGYETWLYDVSEEALERAEASIDRILKRSVEKAELTGQDAEAARAQLRTTVDLKRAVIGADLVIEAVPEKIESKIALMSELERLAAPSAVVASYSSSLSITEMAAVLSDPRRAGGMHFFNPVHRMKLVEVVRALETSPETLEAICQVARRMGKEPVVVRESPGFVTSRINVLIGNEAFYLLQEGVAAARDIDKAVKLGLNHPMGPFEMTDLVGLDTRLSVLEFLHRTLGEKYRPCPLLVQYVKAGRLGKKAGRGVYEYT